ncbi:MAG TPA: hypothetical protein VFG01_04405 [Acidobacteriota bacterium]|nr:hypothetical protein [Acidobacteriota bacterium]
MNVPLERDFLIAFGTDDGESLNDDHVGMAKYLSRRIKRQIESILCCDQMIALEKIVYIFENKLIIKGIAFFYE